MSESLIVDEEEERFAEPGYNKSAFDLLVDECLHGPNRTKKYFNTDEPDDLPITKSGKLLKRYIEHEGFGDHHIEVYDNWICKSSYSNISSRTLQFRDGRVVTFENLKILPPQYYRDGKVYRMTPSLAREQGYTYGGDWHVDLVLRDAANNELERISGVCIGNVPTMLKSRECILYNKSPRELALLGEDPKDPGGYFIITGVEKVILLQEQLSVNKIFLMNMDSKGTIVARMTANTRRGTALIELALDSTSHSIIELRFPSIKRKKDEPHKSINVLRIFRLFGMRDIQDIKNIISLFMKPEHAKKSLLKLTRNIVDFTIRDNDVAIIIDMLGKNALKEDEKMAEVIRVINNDLFPHLNDSQGPDGETEEEKTIRIAYAKIYLLSIMIARFIEHLAGYRALDNRDSWSNKRVEGAGRMMEQLFRNAWRKTLGGIQADIELGKINSLPGIVQNVKNTIITDTFKDSFITSNWGVRGSKTKNNVAQTLVRDSVPATFAHINTVDVSISRTDRQPSLRLVQNSQWGFICPVSTPEGENAGILKNLAITAKVSLERMDNDIIRVLIGDVEKGIDPYVSLDTDLAANPATSTKAMVNGKFLGWCNVDVTRDFLIGKRRRGELPPDMSVIVEDDWLYVDIGPSRLVRPLLIVAEDQELVIDKLNARDAPNNILLNNGSMEYISAWEQEYIKVASKYEDITNRLNKIRKANENLRTAQALVASDPSPENNDRLRDAQEDVNKVNKLAPYTHCELDPQAILSVAAALIPWPDHNQAPRNTYQVSMGKQALGVYHSNHKNRYDGKTKLLAFPDRPMVETEMYDIIGLDDKGPGENITIAFMAFPNTEEDSFVVKKEFLNNGGFRIVKYLTYKTVINHLGDVTEKLDRPESTPGEPPDRYNFIQRGENDDPKNGLPMIGAYLKQGDCVIGKIQTINSTGEKRNESTFMRVGDEGVVDSILVTTDKRTSVITVKLRMVRIPQEGDKFAPRNAQKGTVGLVMSDIDMPTNEEGITPDFIINVHSMPSRMTISYLMELVASKHGAYRCVRVNGGPFQEFDLNTIRKTLVAYKHDQFGYEKLFSGSSGKPLEIPIFMGPVFFQALKHHVKDKVQVRGKGAVKPMTRQPVRGRGNRGGLRFGEMERDAVISHGASAFLKERLMLASDGYSTVFCSKCGSFAVNDNDKFTCKLCGSDSFGRCTIPYAYKLLIHLLGGIGINLHPEFATPSEYMKKIFSKTPELLGEEEIDEEDEEMYQEDQDETELHEEGDRTDFADVYDE